MPDAVETKVVVLISADAEWSLILRDKLCLSAFYPRVQLHDSPFGEWFLTVVAIQQGGLKVPIVFFQGGWGKIAAAASAQYVIDRWGPELVVNLGTCGGFAGEIAEGEIILVNKTIVYDIVELMGDPVAHLDHYTTTIDLSWLREPYPHPVVKTTLVSGDRDLIPRELPELKSRYAAVAGDWESGAIAWVVARNNRRCLILRGVSDLVGENGSPAYADKDAFEHAAQPLMQRLVKMLPDWLSLALQ